MVINIGAVRDYQENTKNVTIYVEDGTGLVLVQVIVRHKGKECKTALALSCKYKGDGYICIIGEVTDSMIWRRSQQLMFAG